MTRIATQLSSTKSSTICTNLRLRLLILPLTMDADKRNKTMKSMDQNLHQANGDSLWEGPVLQCPMMVPIAFRWAPTTMRPSPMRSHNDQIWCLTQCIRVLPSKTESIQWQMTSSLSLTLRSKPETVEPITSASRWTHSIQIRIGAAWGKIAESITTTKSLHCPSSLSPNKTPIVSDSRTIVL